MLPFDEHVAGRRDLGFQHRVLFQPAHEHAGPPVDEPAGQPLMQRIGQTILYRARALLPMRGIAKPVGPVGGEGPGADVGDAVGERVDVAVGAVGIGDLAGEPVVGDDAVAGEEAEERRRPARRGWPARSCGSRAPGRCPRAARRARGAVGERPHGFVADGDVEGVDVVRRRRLGQALARRRQVEARLQRVERGEIEIAVPPLDRLHRVEAVRSRAPRPARPRTGRPGW